MTRIDADAINGLIRGMAVDTRAWLERTGRGDPLVIGIHTGGLWVAEPPRLEPLVSVVSVGLMRLSVFIGCSSSGLIVDGSVEVVSTGGG